MPYRRSAEDIGDLYESRKRDQGVEVERMRRIQQVMDNEIALPLPEISESEEPMVANLALQGMDQLSRRIASVLPQHHWPPLNPADDESERRAQNRGLICMGWHQANHIKRILGKRARYFLTYAVSPVLVKPDKKERIPRWYVKDPLHSFPAESIIDNFTPSDCIFAMTHSYKWLKDNFGKDVEKVRKPPNWDWSNDANNWEVRFDVLEYQDDEQHSLVLLGFEEDYISPYQKVEYTAGRTATFLMQVPNMAGKCTVVQPGRINVSKTQGHFDPMIGMYQASATFMALSIIQQRKATWPTTYLVARPMEEPEVVRVADPFSGRPGEVRGGDLLPIPMDPSLRTLELMDRLTHEQRQAASIPAEFGGMSQSDNVRTGRRGAQVMGASIDFTIAEAQDIFAESLEAENKAAIAIDKGYFNYKKSYFIATRGYKGKVDYKPSATWETDEHVVDYPIAGTDLQNLPIEGGQRITMQTMSRETFMEMDPIIPDAKAEKQRVQREMIQAASLGALQQVLSMPDAPMQLTDAARLDELMAQGKEFYEAMNIIQREAQDRQATAAPPTPPGQPGPPEAQPGVAMPGQGVEQPTMEQDTSLANMAAMLSSLGAVQTAQRHRGGNT